MCCGRLAREVGLHPQRTVEQRRPRLAPCASQSAPGSDSDDVIVALQGHRVGRVGQVTGSHVGDTQWDPLVPPSKSEPDGEMGRRILVRWDMTCGPESRDQVIHLPSEMRFTSGELRPTISEVRSRSLAELREAMNDRANWVGLLASFAHERALSDFIAAYPHRLEDGLVPHPSDKLRERIFSDRTRLDVLLLDRHGQPVIVECKQNAPTVADLKQLRHYMKLLAAETTAAPRGVLVHGGALRLHADVANAASTSPPVELVRYHLDLDFARSM